MHFCKLPRLTLGPADWCSLGCLFQVLSVDRGEEDRTLDPVSVSRVLQEVAQGSLAVLWERW